MKKITGIVALFVFTLICCSNTFSQGRVGINTNAPQTGLHVKDSGVVFTALGQFLPGQPNDPPVTGVGARMMWYPHKAAFRVGHLDGNGSHPRCWDKDSIGNYSFAAGSNTKALGPNSVAMGNGTVARGPGSIAMGSGNNATEWMSIALGQLSNALGPYSTAIGLGANAIGDHSVAFGSKATGDHSAAFGRGISSRAYAAFTIGQYNDSIISSSRTTWVDTDPVFIIGNGLDTDDRRNAFMVLKNAKTGINTSSPDAMLHIVTNGTSGGGYNSKSALIIEDNTDSFIQLSNPVAEENGILSGSNVTTIRSGMVFRPDSAISFRAGGNDTKMLLTKTGDVIIDGVLTQNSDMRLKRNIQPLQNSLQKVLALSGYHYNWIERSNDAQLQTGVLAQEIEKKMPELVKRDEGGVRSVNHICLIPYMIEAMKEQDKKINDQNKKIEALEKEITEIRKFLIQK